MMPDLKRILIKISDSYLERQSKRKIFPYSRQQINVIVKYSDNYISIINMAQFFQKFARIFFSISSNPKLDIRYGKQGKIEKV